MRACWPSRWRRRPCLHWPLAAGCAPAAVLIVTDLLFPSRRRIDPEELREAEHRLGELAVAALAADAV